MCNKTHSFVMLGIGITIQCDTASAHDIVSQNFACAATVGDDVALRYLVESAACESRFTISRLASNFRSTAADTGQLIYFLEADLVVQLQLLRPELLFLHSAVISDGKKAYLFTGPSGAGKSTTCWGLLHHNFHYLSDELAPVVLEQACVSPYLHALCLKAAPPTAYPAPASAIVTRRGIHIPLATMPTSPINSVQPIESIFFIEHRPENHKATIERVGHAEAATRLYPNILNALAHGNDGLDAALQLTQDIGCYRIDTADLADTCDLIAGHIGNRSPAGWQE